jgi:hypothetical protein
VSEVGYNEYLFKMDATLQLIIDQFRELKNEIRTITAELENGYVCTRYWTGDTEAALLIIRWATA